MKTQNTMQTIKGVTRQYRKAMRNAGMTFPISGAFHVRIRNGTVLPPADILLHPDTEVVSGPAPINPPSAPVGYFGEERDPFCPDWNTAPDDLPALPTMYKRRVSTAIRNGKEVQRTNYAVVKNPKPGLTYFVRQPLPSGKYKYTSMEFSKIVEAKNVA